MPAVSFSVNGVTLSGVKLFLSILATFASSAFNSSSAACFNASAASCVCFALIALSNSTFAASTAAWSAFWFASTCFALSKAALTASSSGSPAFNGCNASAVAIDFSSSALFAFYFNASFAVLIACAAALSCSGVAFESAALALPSVTAFSNGVTVSGV